MHIGVLQFELLIPGSASLKDKRRVVKSLKDRLHREHMVSVAEVAALDQHRLAILALVLVANDAKYVSATMDRIIERLRCLHDAELGEFSREVISGDVIERGDDEPDAGELWSAAESRSAREGGA